MSLFVTTLNLCGMSTWLTMSSIVPCPQKEPYSKYKFSRSLFHKKTKKTPEIAFKALKQREKHITRYKNHKTIQKFRKIKDSLYILFFSDYVITFLKTNSIQVMYVMQFDIVLFPQNRFLQNVNKLDVAQILCYQTLLGYYS